MKAEDAVEILQDYMSKSMNSELIEAINCLIMEYRDKEREQDLDEERRLYYEDEY